MIVTKEQEQQTLLKRRCWIFEADLKDDYRMINTTIHWKQGMEVFESMEECHAEVTRLLKIKMDAGRCPRCEYQNLQQTTRDITYLDRLRETKCDALYQCDACHTLWYNYTRSSLSLAYDKKASSKVMDWAQRNLTPAIEVTTVLQQIGDISSTANQKHYPAHVVLSNGIELEQAIIILDNKPPPEKWFARQNWFYLDEVKNITHTRYVYPAPIANYILNHANDFIYIKEINTREIIRFDASAGIFMSIEFIGLHFELMNSSTMTKQERATAKTIHQMSERGGPDFWSVTPPPKPTFIWGKLE